MNIEGEINGEYSLDDWKDKCNDILKKEKKHYRVIRKESYFLFQFFCVVFFIGIIILGSFFVYYLSEGKLQASVSNNLTCPEIPVCPDIQIPACPDCNPVYNLNSTATLNFDADAIEKICNQS